MKPKNLSIKNVRFTRLGYNKIDFEADYEVYRRRGTVVYDVNREGFVTHNSDIDLLLAIVRALSTYRHTNTTK